MAAKIHAARSGAAWKLARAQHGVLARTDLLNLGFSDAGIKHRVASGRLHPVAAGVYAVGRPDLSPHGRWMVAVLACGEGAVLSHRSAAELWGIGFQERRRIDVSIRRRSRLQRAGMKVRSRPTLPERSVVRRFGIPVTNPTQTLIDLAIKIKENPPEDPEELKKLKHDFLMKQRRYNLKMRYVKGYAARLQNYQQLRKNLDRLADLFVTLHEKFGDLMENLSNEKQYLRDSIELQADALRIK